jgi:hypothetical protein
VREPLAAEIRRLGCGRHDNEGGTATWWLSGCRDARAPRPTIARQTSSVAIPHRPSCSAGLSEEHGLAELVDHFDTGMRGGGNGSSFASASA